MLFIDTSALVKRYVQEAGTDLVVRRMDEDRDWVVSSVARAEAEIALCRLGFERDDSTGVWDRFRDDWDRCHLVPVDPASLERAGEIGCRHDVRTLDALHLAAADRLSRPSVVLTFDARLARAARELGLIVEGA